MVSVRCQETTCLGVSRDHLFAANQSGQLVSPLEGEAALLEVKTYAQISPRRGHSFLCVPGCG